MSQAKIVRRQIHGPYPKSGNFGTQKKYWKWSLYVGNKLILPNMHKKSDCVKCARDMGVIGTIAIETIELEKTTA